MNDMKRIAPAANAGAAAEIKSKEVKRFRTKTFKSGNSLALRLPATLGLAPGVEMELRVEDGQYYSFESTATPRRKFAIDKIWGSAANLTPLDPAERQFVERALWGDGGRGAPRA